MIQLFKSVLLMSISGTILTIILLILKHVLKKHFSARWMYYIWSAVLIAMTVPIFAIFPRSVHITETEHLSASVPISVSEKPVNNTTPYISGTHAPSVNTDVTGGETITVAALEKKRFDFDIYHMIAFLWLFGMCIFMLCAWVSYLRLLIHLRKTSNDVEECAQFDTVKKNLNISRKIRLRKSDEISSPMLVGVFRPAIYIPSCDITDESFKMVFLHELTHYKRQDLIYKQFSLFVNAVHWFNPAAYAASKEINRMCELSCDERITQNMTSDEKKLYMKTIVEIIKN